MRRPSSWLSARGERLGERALCGRDGRGERVGDGDAAGDGERGKAVGASRSPKRAEPAADGEKKAASSRSRWAGRPARDGVLVMAILAPDSASRLIMLSRDSRGWVGSGSRWGSAGARRGGEVPGGSSRGVEEEDRGDANVDADDDDAHSATAEAEETLCEEEEAPMLTALRVVEMELLMLMVLSPDAAAVAASMCWAAVVRVFCSESRRVAATDG